MKSKSVLRTLRIFAYSGIVVAASYSPIVNAQQNDSQHADHQQQQATDATDLQQQIRDMQSKIARLEAALKQNHSAAGMQMKEGNQPMDSMPEMKGMKKMGGMGMKDGTGSMSKDVKMSGMGEGGKDGMGGMDGMGDMSDQKQGMSGMGMMGKGMMMMGKMKSMGDMSMPSSLPGFPGASHIYHIGADGFFLDHSEHITLTTEQQTALNQIKEDSMLKQADFDRKSEAAEQELWVLTASDSPDAKQIEDKISEIAKLQGKQRIEFIRSVGKAAEVLSEQQRNALTGATNNAESKE